MPKPVDVLIKEAEKKFQEVMDVIHPLPKEKENKEANLIYYQALQELPPLQRALFRQVTPLLQLALETEKEILTTSDSEKLKAEVAHRVLTLAERLITSRVEKPNQTNVLISLSRLPDEELDNRLKELEEQVQKAEMAKRQITEKVITVG